MAVEPRIEVVGLKEVQKAIRDLGDKGAKKALRLANKAAADIVAADARERAPVITGAFRASIKPRAGQAFASVVGGGPKVPYFAAVEYGGRVGRNKATLIPIRRGGRTIYPALAARRDDVQRTYADEISAVIDDYGLAD